MRPSSCSPTPFPSLMTLSLPGRCLICQDSTQTSPFYSVTVKRINLSWRSSENLLDFVDTYLHSLLSCHSLCTVGPLKLATSLSCPNTRKLFWYTFSVQITDADWASIIQKLKVLNTKGCHQWKFSHLISCNSSNCWCKRVDGSLLVRMSASHVSASWLLILPPDSIFLLMWTLGGSNDDQVTEFLPPTWEAWIKFQLTAAPGPTVSHCRHLESETGWERVFSFSHFLSNW